jgi:hypothetical protein
MAAAGVTYREIRFLLGDELTEVYVFCQAHGDCPLGIQGWHHRTFPKSITVEALLLRMFAGDEDPLLWGQEAPK